MFGIKARAKQWLLVGCLLISGSSSAFLAGDRSEPPVLAANGSVQVAFTPGDDAAGLVITAIGQARKQILVQAFSFTHGGIADALIAAHRRGVDVKLIVDREQTERMERGKVPMVAAAGVPVWVDGAHQSAHNKMMLIDAGTSQAALITGSYNFTNAAQYKNAENLLVLRGNDKLIGLYQENWKKHFAHARPFR